MKVGAFLLAIPFAFGATVAWFAVGANIHVNAMPLLIWFVLLFGSLAYLAIGGSRSRWAKEVVSLLLGLGVPLCAMGVYYLGATYEAW